MHYGNILYCMYTHNGDLCMTVVAQQEGDLRLAGYLANEVSGRLELFFNNQWGTLCINEFTKESADIACRLLGNVNVVEYGTADKLWYVDKMMLCYL